MKLQAKKIRLPSKRTINLANVTERKFNFKLFLPGIIILVIAVAAFMKFGVIDRFVALSKAESAVASVQRQIDEGYDRIASFGDLVEKYAHYTYSDMTPEELNRVDRTQIINVMDRVLMSKLSIDQWTITDNTLVVFVMGQNLQEINSISQNLYSEPSVEYCEVKSAATDNRDRRREEQSDLVRAQITVYFVPVSSVSEGQVTEG